MSRSGVKGRKHESERMPSELDGIPMPPQIVQNVQAAMKARRQAMLFSFCRDAAWNGHFPLFRSPEAHGARLADMLVDQIERQIRERQSRIVVPKPGVTVPR
jgi:hypothetical protein